MPTEEKKDDQGTLFDTDEFLTPGIVDLDDGRDEMNLAEFPVCLLYRPRDHSIKTIEFNDKIRDSKTGEVIERKVTVAGSERWGLPNSFDDEVLLALLQLTRIQGYPKKVYFTKRKIADILKKDANGERLGLIEESLKRWLGISLVYDNSWRNKQSKEFETHGIHMLEEVFLKEDQRSPTEESYIIWGQQFHTSMSVGNLKSLNMAAFRSLRRPIAKRLFRFLDKRFYLKKELSFDMHELVRNKIGLDTEKRRVNDLKRSLLSGIEELEKIGFLEPMDPKERFKKVYRGKYQVRFVSVSKDPKSDQPISLEPHEEVEGILVSLGVSATKARQIAKEYDHEFIKLKVAHYEFILEKHGKSNSDNAAPSVGFLIASIRENYTPPKGFRSREERDKSLAEDAEIRERMERSLEDLERARREQRDRVLAAEKKLIEKAMKGMDESERDFFRACAYKAARDEGDKAIDYDGPIGECSRHMALVEESKRRLGVDSVE